jgi:hypothetical protein
MSPRDSCAHACLLGISGSKLVGGWHLTLGRSGSRHLSEAEGRLGNKDFRERA